MSLLWIKLKVRHSENLPLHAVFGKGSTYGAGSKFGSKNAFGKKQKFGPGTVLGDWSTVGGFSSFEDGTVIGSDNQVRPVHTV